MKKSIIALLVVVFLFLVIFFTQGETVSIDVYHVDRGPVESTVSNTRSGTVQACQRSKIAPLASGQISAVYVEEGDSVKTGDLLMELWNEHFKAQVLKAEAALQAHRLQQHSVCIGAASDEREAQRMALLAKKQLAAEEIVDRATSKAGASEAICLAAKSQEKEFEAQLTYQKALLDQTFIRAPFSGTIANITGEVGEIATPSPPGVLTPPVIDLLTPDCVYVSAPIDEVDASELKLGQPVRVSLDAYRDTKFFGQVKRISPFVEDLAKQARTVNIEIAFDSKELSLLVGYSADAEVILVKKDSALRIPTEALLEDNQVWFVNADNQVEATTIRTGIGNWKFTEVLDGLEQGQQVITSLGMSNLAPGVTVTVTNQESKP